MQVLGASPTGSSHLLAELADANCLIIVEPGRGLGTGDEVESRFSRAAAQAECVRAARAEC